ncbi:MAG: TIGR03546 family protein [Elusimicrobiota bacterium]|jgi:uncharacterized protein (TIGR03546 family)
MFLLRPFRYLAQALAAQDSPRQLAAGFALGAFAGLVPKSSIVSTLALVLIAATQVNPAAGYGAAALFSLLSPLADPLTHRIGALLLVDAAPLSPLWTRLYNVPVVPWTGFNNTVTLGSILLGLALLGPLYLLMTRVFARYRDAFGAKIRRLRVIGLLLGAETAGKVL